MQNINLFELIGYESDPVYQQLSQLKIGESFTVDGICISFNKFYEVESENEHIPFKDMLKCYHHLSDVLVKQVTA